MKTPNIILLTIDTLRADMLGCYGYDASITPNIDYLAANGIRFEQAITGGSWTQAAFPVLFTSTYASTYGGCLGPLARERPSPIEALVEYGYVTGGFSTSPLLSRTYEYNRGFEYFTDLVPAEVEPPLRRVKGGERLLRNPLTHYVARMFGSQTRPARIYVSAEEVTTELCGWLEAVDEPYFAWAHYMDVHWPYHREETLIDPQEIAQAWRDLAHLHGANWHGLTTTTAQRQHYVELYEQAIRYTDAQIGRLVEYLDQKDDLDNTIIIVVSDHGEEFLERGRWGHFESNLYDEILHIPFVMYLPCQIADKVVTQQVRTLDLMPTILDMCGCPIPDELEGTSLVPLFARSDGIYPARESISEMWRDDWHIIAVRTETHKYIWDSKQPDAPLLFDLQNDSGEQHDIHDQYPNLTRRMQYHVDEHLRRAAQTMPTETFEEPEVDDELLRRLRDLGYVE